MCSDTGTRALPRVGFPIRKSPGHRLFSTSPKLIAAGHVLHRLLAPRHPPMALIILTKRTSLPLCSFQGSRRRAGTSPARTFELEPQGSGPPALPTKFQEVSAFLRKPPNTITSAAMKPTNAPASGLKSTTSRAATPRAITSTPTENGSSSLAPGTALTTTRKAVRSERSQATTAATSRRDSSMARNIRAMPATTIQSFRDSLLISMLDLRRARCETHLTGFSLPGLSLAQGAAQRPLDLSKLNRNEAARRRPGRRSAGTRVVDIEF